MDLESLKGKTIAFAASGGLDSCTITRWLVDNGVKVVAFTADLAQPDEKNLDDIGKRMRAAGAEDFVLINAREPLAEAGIKLIQAQAYYEGKYWNTTGIARHVTVAAMLPEMRKRGIKILSHGATGRGNDQVRFQLATNMLAPEMEVYAPWRDEAFLTRFGGRREMIEFCNERKLPITATLDSPYSTDANMLGLTHEAGKLESLDTPATFIKPGMGVHAADAPDKPELFTIRFEEGIPTRINDKPVDLVKAIQVANECGGRNAVGIGFHLVENRFVGIKSRGVYESPGMEVIGSCYAMLIQMVLDRRAREFYDQLSTLVAKQVYQGYYFDVASSMAQNALNTTAKLVTGTITVNLYKGNISFVEAKDVPHSLYSEATASMEKIGSYNHADSEGLLRVFGVSARALATSGQITER